MLLEPRSNTPLLIKQNGPPWRRKAQTACEWSWRHLQHYRPWFHWRGLGSRWAGRSRELKEKKSSWKWLFWKDRLCTHDLHSWTLLSGHWTKKKKKKKKIWNRWRHAKPSVFMQGKLTKKLSIIEKESSVRLHRSTLRRKLTFSLAQPKFSCVISPFPDSYLKIWKTFPIFNPSFLSFLFMWSGFSF